MRRQLARFIKELGDAALSVQELRRRRQDWRTEEWLQRFDSRQWPQAPGEIPEVGNAPRVA